MVILTRVVPFVVGSSNEELLVPRVSWIGLLRILYTFCAGLSVEANRVHGC